MVHMKQTAHGSRSALRPVDIQAARFAEKPQEEQFVGVPDDEDEDTWPDLDAPHKGKEVGETSKSTGEQGDQPAPQAEGNPNPAPQAEGNPNPAPQAKANPQPPAQAEGGPTVTLAAGPNPAITAPPQDPTDEPQDLQAGTTTDDPGVREYVDSYLQAAKDWFDKVQSNKIEAYKVLYDTLLPIGKPLIKGLEQANGDTVLDSIADKSGQFISKVDKCMVYVSKEEEKVAKKPVAVNPNAKKAIDCAVLP